MIYLTHLSESKLEQLRGDVVKNLDRYRGDGFDDLAHEPGWGIALSQQLDIEGLRDLDGSDNSSATDLRDSLLVWDVLRDLSPSLANEERIWVRLSHVEGFAYSQRRWLKTEGSDEAVEKSVGVHLFARTQTRIRDDHAISRLWWNAYIATQCYPENSMRALELLLTRADVRSNIVERVWLTGRRKLASGVFRAMDDDPFVLMSEQSFREFMKSVNLLGAGIVFEALTDMQVDGFLRRCSEEAQERLTVPTI